jgi:S-formylglutathione hydrolase FrmB
MIKNKVYLIFLITLFACIDAKQVNDEDLYPAKINGWVLNKVFNESAFDTNYALNFKGIKYNIQVNIPKNNNHQLILFLPGWNLPASDWRTKTHVVDSALTWGYSVLLVDMGKSVYLDTFYSDTRNDYKNHPTRQWLWNVVLQPYRDAGFFSNVYKGLKSHVFGLSTGARGAVALAQDHNLSVNFVAALSGDYNPLVDTSDALMINSMGRYYQNKTRWQTGSNNLLHKGAFSGHLYLAHGRGDRIVPVRHSIEFADGLNKWNSVEIGWPFYTYFPDGAGHDYRFWNEAGLRAINQLKALYP